MSKQADKIVDWVTMSVTCGNCHTDHTTVGIEDWMYAEWLDENGWHVTSGDVLVCPKCDKRKKK